VRRFFGLLLFVAACGGGGAPEAKIVVAPQPSSRPAPINEPPPKQGTPIEYVAIPTAWVEKYVPAPAAAVKAWSEDKSNAGAIGTPLRVIYVTRPKGSGELGRPRAKQRCGELAARVTTKKEDFAKVAKSSSDDPDTAAKGGLTDAASLPEPVRTAAGALAPGQTSDCLETDIGAWLVRRDPASDEELTRAYQKAHAKEVTEKLAVDILARLRTTDSARAAIASAVDAALGDAAQADPARPTPALVDHDRLGALHLPPESKTALEAFMTKAHAGEALDAPLALEHGLAVARAWGPPAAH
jgi:hypothetical protein